MSNNLIYETEHQNAESAKCCLKTNKNFDQQNTGTFSSDYLQNAYKALIFGCFVMISGALMATIGYFSDDFESNAYNKNENKQFHFSNLSLAGAIIMGIGGFITLASCVIAFEACDSTSTTKVIHTKFRTYQPSLQDSFTFCQTRNMQTDRRAMKTAFLQFSEKIDSLERQNSNKLLLKEKILRSPSAPNLTKNNSLKNSIINLTSRQIMPSDLHVSTKRRKFENFRQTLSVDETARLYLKQSRDSVANSRGSSQMTIDIHGHDNAHSVSIPIYDSVCSKRRPLIRQRPVLIDIDDDGSHTRRSSNNSDSSVLAHSHRPSSVACQPHKFTKNISLDH